MDKLTGLVTAEQVHALLVKQGLNPENLKRRSIRIGVPCYRDISPYHYLSMIQTVSLLESLGVSCEVKVLIGMPVVDARNAISNRMLESDRTDVLFIDADEGWDAFDVVRLIASGLPLVAGVGKRKSLTPDDDLTAWCAYPLIADGTYAMTEAGFVKVEWCGTGMMLINRTVLRQMAAAHPEWRRESLGTQNEEFYEFFAMDLDETGSRRNGEDVSFCMRWRALGGDIYVDKNIKMDHWGSYNYTGDFSQFFPDPPSP
jgi:hypothetical protein